MVQKINLKKLDYKIKSDKFGIRYEHTFKNNKNEKILVWIYSTEHKEANDLMSTWVKKGYVKKFIPVNWWIETYVYDKNGFCFSKYNPTVIPGTHTLNFKYILPADEKNLNILLRKCHEMANSK